MSWKDPEDYATLLMIAGGVAIAFGLGYLIHSDNARKDALGAECIKAGGQWIAGNCVRERAVER